MGQRYAPRISEAILARLGERMTAGSVEDGATSAPGTGNLFEPLPGTTAIRGGFGGRDWSLANRIQMTPPTVRIAALAGLAGMTLLLRRRA